MNLQESARRVVLLYLQIAAAVVSLLLGIAQITKESSPLVQKIQESRIHTQQIKSEDLAKQKAREISNMQISWTFRGHDGVYRYYSDISGRYWARVNIAGIYEYSENPNISQVANNNNNIIR